MATTKALFQANIDQCYVKKLKKADKIPVTIKKKLIMVVNAKQKQVTARVFPDKMELRSPDKKKIRINLVNFNSIQKVHKATQEQVLILEYKSNTKKPICNLVNRKLQELSPVTLPEGHPQLTLKKGGRLQGLLNEGLRRLGGQVQQLARLDLRDSRRLKHQYHCLHRNAFPPVLPHRLLPPLPPLLPLLLHSHQ
ncbi:unnamed protein product [Dibothriocephalus latus]|uniref:DUF5734 domain-containing protein n=1 Tax=Dibothriocephalus latus TaxID=60516 RepID=A0A3P7LEL8_DIBLA|nr:unnamed protein product [Dibothriocephalus latus]